MIDRRRLLGGAAGLLGSSILAGCTAPLTRPAGSPSAMAENGQIPPLHAALLADIEERTFRFFWNTTNPANGLAPDRWPSAPFASIAATGFALSSYPIGVARGWIGRDAAAKRTLATLRFFWNAPQGPGASGTSGYKGFFYHFLDMNTGLRYATNELSSVDTTLLLGGILFAGQWFDADNSQEREIRELAHNIYARVEWPWMQVRAPLIAMGWRPEQGFINNDWIGYDEGMLVYILALGAPEHPVRPDSWEAWCGGYADQWHGTGNNRFIAFAPLFGYQYSHCWVDFRGIRDAVMRREGFDYFENSRRATYFQRDYAAANPMGWAGYSKDIWGLTACDGPGGGSHVFKGTQRRFRTYSARGPSTMPHGFDDGTIAPTAALGSLPFAPEIVAPAAEALRNFQNGRIYGKYGFLDAFNPSFIWPEMKGPRGTVDPRLGWVDDDMLGIDQGPIVMMLANHRDDLVWRTMRQCPPIADGLKRAGFAGGWL